MDETKTYTFCQKWWEIWACVNDWDVHKMDKM